MNCDRVKPLVPVYLDGELREELAAPLRRHLLECPDCRAVVAETKALSSFFVPTPEVAVPDGFAARVARRAFAGDVGTAEDHGVLVPAPRSAPGVAAEARASRFVMNLVAVAAALLVGFTILLGSEGQSGLGTSSVNATYPESQVIERLQELNAADRGDAEVPAKASTADPSSDAGDAENEADEVGDPNGR